MRVSKKVHALHTKWLDLKRDGFSNDFELAVLYTDLDREMGQEKLRLYLHNRKTGLGMSGTAVAKVESMISAYRLVPQRTVWKAIGWNGVSRIRRAKTANSLREAINAVMVIHRKVQRPLKDSEVLDIMEKYLPAFMKAQQLGRIHQAVVYKEREMLIEALQFCVKKEPALHKALEKFNSKVLAVAGLPPAAPEASLLTLAR